MFDTRSTSPDGPLRVPQAPQHDEVRRTPGLTGDIPPTRPPRAVRMTIKPMSRILNPLVRKLAGKKHMAMAAQMHHTGRRTGRSFMTPVGAKRSGVYFLIPLTFGNQSDWCRNVRASGGATIRCEGADYHVIEPEILATRAARAEIRATFNLADRVFLRLMGITQVMRLRVAPPDGRSPTPEKRSSIGERHTTRVAT
jgi:deazaflavin-dependent oxidoreductase (nitroreductase family)